MSNEPTAGAGRAPVVVRAVRPEEHEQTGALTAEAYAVDGLLDRGDGSVDVDYQAKLRDVKRRAAEADVLVAVDGADDTLLGTVTWCPPGSAWREIGRRADQGEFRMLAVAAAGRRRGVGRALVAHCLQRAYVSGMQEVLLSSLPQMSAAHALYAGFGFVRAPELDHSPVPGVHLWAFRLPLA